MGRRAARLGTGGLLALALVGCIGAGPALACGGLVGPGGTVQLARTTTLAAYHDGVEHYVTAFEYNGGGAKFGSIIPLPGVPTKVEKGGDWTLQRLVRETQPVRETFQAAGGAATAFADKAEVLITAKVDALDLTVLRGGGAAVGTWARKHGFGLSPDAPAVLDFYAQRSPIFLASSFDPGRAATRGQRVGDGTPVHLTIPTSNPWVPLRILGLGLGRKDPVRAGLYLLTDHRPALLRPDQGVRLDQSRAASQQLLTDLRLDRGMGWLPGSGMWLSYLTVDTTAGSLQHDLAVDASGHDRPSPLAAGLDTTADIGAGELDLSSPPAILPRLLWPAVALVAGLALVVALIARTSNASRR
jgi:hypothetical protein